METQGVLKRYKKLKVYIKSTETDSVHKCTETESVLKKYRNSKCT